MSTHLQKCFMATVALLVAGTADCQTYRNFEIPAASSRPITYWHWMNGNISKEGITKDLEAMKAVGIEGTLLFSAGTLPRGEVIFMSPEWWDCLAHTIRESDRLNMKFGVYNSDGWSMSGGPWITHEESMKQLSWEETTVAGGQTIEVKLPQPKTNNIYKDIAVIAFPALPDDAPIPVQSVSSSTLVANSKAMLDGNPKTVAQFKDGGGHSPDSVVLDFGDTKTFRRVVFQGPKSVPFLHASAQLRYSSDGENFIALPDEIPMNLKAESFIDQLTYSFEPVSARYLQLSVQFEASATTTPVPMSQDSVNVAEVRFYETPRVKYWEPKSGESKRIRHDRQQTFIRELNQESAEELPSELVVTQQGIFDLTEKVDHNGVLRWDAPDGTWTVQRIGYTSTNRMVNPSTREGRGLECDKMDARAVEKHFNAYTGKIIDLSEKLIGRPIDYMQMESWEAGVQNWTAGFEKEFEKQNGYSILPYLPVLAGGYVVDSYSHSDKFLWDFRNTVAQMMADNYWATMYRCAKDRGVTVPGEGSGMQHYLYDPIRYMQHVDIPMGEFWSNEVHTRADVKNAASVAATLGRDLVGAEAFTSGHSNVWEIMPYDLKKIGDEAFSLGANFFVMHSYVHQPFEVGPGLTLGKFGNHFQRLNPWFSRSKGWFDYLARCQYMLQQGKPVADLAYFTGEGIPSYLGLPWELEPKLPCGYNYDGVNLELLKQMEVNDGQACIPSGACYRALIFPNAKMMTPELLREMNRLVSAGAYIVADKPDESPSLVGGTEAETEFRKLVNDLWGSDDGAQGNFIAHGKGKLYSGATVEHVLKETGTIPDFRFEAESGSGQVNFAHRRTDDTDIYFLANYEESPTSGTAKFRVAADRVPEIWNPDTGTTSAVAFSRTDDKQMEVALHLDALESLFVVFKPGNASAVALPPAPKEIARIQISDPWNLSFVGTDTFNLTFDDLTDWSKSEDERVKFFSGSTTYTQTFKLPKLADNIELDLGDANNQLAAIWVNGREVALLWKPPYKVDISTHAKEGANKLEIVLTNTAVNSLIGDERYPKDVERNAAGQATELPGWLNNPAERKSARKTFAAYSSLTADSELDPSGLMGPVTIRLLEH